MVHGVAKAEKAESYGAGDADLVFAASSPLAQVRRACLRIASSDATVLLTGETGTGKEVFARLFHSHSERSARPFVPVNCGAIPEALLESELFGYVKGAFTGAISSRKGRVALAEGGTLFLDEIGELPLSLQVKLLRLLQERTYEPVGSSESQSASFRLVAATNRDLAEEVRAGRFRRDLYYRLHVCPVRLPSLRERRMDIAPLFFHFWHRRGEQRQLSAEVVRCLEAYAWPGNVRELENLVERVSVCSEGSVIQLSDLPAFVRGEPEELPFGMLIAGNPMRDHLMPSLVSNAPGHAPGSLDGFVAPGLGAPLPPRRVPTPLPLPPGSQSLGFVPPPAPPALPPTIHGATPMEELLGPGTVTQELSLPNDSALPLPIDLPRMLRELETAYINRALARTGGNKKEAAKLLGMGRTTLVEKLRRRNADTSTP